MVRLRPLQLLAATIGGGSVLVALARIFMDPTVRMPSVLEVAVVLLTLLGVGLLMNRVGYHVPALPQGLPRENAFETSMRYFSSTTVLRAALAEAPIFVALLLSALGTRSWLLLLLALPGVGALFWVHVWPSARTAAAVEGGLEREGAESHLSETLGFVAT
jgi:hypothetical protein